MGINGGISSATEDTNTNSPAEFEIITSSDIQEAEKLSEQGKLEDAIALMQTAIMSYQQTGKIVQQAYALRNLSLIYLQQQNWQATETTINQALQLTNQIKNQQQRNLLLNLCLEIQGQLQLAIDRPEIALQTWQRSSDLAYIKPHNSYPKLDN